MRYLVTGGAGFIGSNYVRSVLERGDHVTNVDALTYAGVAATVDELDAFPNHVFRKGDIRDADLLADVVPGHDVVVHFAAESHVDRSITDPMDFLTTNVVGTAQLVDAAYRAGIPRFVHVSTDEVYGSIAVGAAAETDILDPSSPYSASKASSDLVVLSYATTYAYDVVVTRCTNNYGPYQFPEKVIPLFTTNLLDGVPVPLYGDGRNERDWLHVADHCAAIDVIIDRGTSGEIYNIGTGAPVSNNALTELLLGLTNRDRSFVEFVADRPGHDFRYSVATDKLHDLGWRPERSFERGLEDTVAWYVDRRDWWEPLKGAM